MKYYLLLLLFILFSCKESTTKVSVNSDISDNQELAVMYQADQSDRQSGNIDWSSVSERDRQRETRVYELLDSNLVITSEDYANAAMIFQHGRDTTASAMAVKMMRKAIELDATRNKWLLAAAIDRDLMRRGEPQIYGTQYTKMGADQPWVLYNLDTTQITDEERLEYGVETLAEQKIKVQMMNKKKLSQLLDAGKSTDEIVDMVKNDEEILSEYNLSESGINAFGYELMAQDQNEEALKILKLNTELYPDAFNTYDSYGECLLKLGRKEEGIAAYQKSLELNPENENAKRIIEENG